MFAGLLLVGTYTCAVSSVFAEQPHWYYWFPKKSICSVTYSVELYTCQRNLNLSSRLKWDARHLEKQAFITSKILSNKRVFFNPSFSFHIPFNNWEFGKTLTTIELGLLLSRINYGIVIYTLSPIWSFVFILNFWHYKIIFMYISRL